MQTVVLRTHDGGSHWSVYDLPWEPTPWGAPARSNAEPASFSCPNPNTCIGIASVQTGVTGPAALPVTSLLEWHTDDGGATWAHSWITQPLRIGAGVVGPGDSVTCFDASNCLAVVRGFSSPPSGTSSSPPVPAAEVLSTSDGGASWGPGGPPLPAGFQVASLTCSSSSHCFVVGNTQDSRAKPPTAVVMASTDGGSTWTNQPLPPGIAGVDSITCPSTTTCYAVGEKPSAGGTSGTEGETELLKN